MTIKVMRDNVVLSIDDRQKERYLDRGYSVIDTNGNVVEQSEPKTLASLKTAYVEQKQQIKSLNEEIASLKAKIESLTSAKPKKQAKQQEK